jgi:16S rRNA (cytosine967-C5)-methyltransferase
VPRPDEGRAGPRGEAGIAARKLAAHVLWQVLDRRTPLDEALETAVARRLSGPLDERDRAFARLLVVTVLRRRGTLDAVLARFIDRPLGAAGAEATQVLRTAVAQLLLLATPAHAAIDQAVQCCRDSQVSARYAGLANAVLRKVATQGPDLLAGLDGPRLDTPDWLWHRWAAAYGADVARRIAEANASEPLLDLTAKADAAAIAKELGGELLATGSIRLANQGRVDLLTGYAEGRWWVQDAAAALPARLFGDPRGRAIADLCAAPGGKTAQLAAVGAHVTALDRSPARAKRLAGNLARLGLAADIVTADAAAWAPGRYFDGVLLDAPCLATGTIRRHPDIPYLKQETDLAALTVLQAGLLDRACALVKPGGTLVYCTCSLEPEEGPRQIAALLARHADLRRHPIAAGEIGGEASWLTPDGDLRTFPFHTPSVLPNRGGMDGFFAARLIRAADGAGEASA